MYAPFRGEEHSLVKAVLQRTRFIFSILPYFYQSNHLSSGTIYVRDNNFMHERGVTLVENKEVFTGQSLAMSEIDAIGR